MLNSPDLLSVWGCSTSRRTLAQADSYTPPPEHQERPFEDMEMKPKDVETCSQDSTASGFSSKGDSLSVVSAIGARDAFRRGGVLPTSICLSKAALGAGVLSVAAHGAEVGAVYFFVCLVLGGLLTVASIRMIANASVETGCWSYEDICEELLHPAMSLFTGFINVCNCLGAAAGYLIVCGQVFQVGYQGSQVLVLGSIY